MEFHRDIYRDVQTVTFAGTTFSFAAVNSQGSGYEVYYTFIETQEDGSDEGDSKGGEKSDSSSNRSDDKKPEDVGEPVSQSWTVPATLEFPTELRPVGMALLTEPVLDPDTGKPSTSKVLAGNSPFTIVIDETSLWLFRISSDAHSILADRFIFDLTERKLVKANDIRFVHSGHADLPANDKDRYGSTDPMGDHFVEPTFQLTLDCQIESDSCAVLLVPDTQKSGCGCWHFIAVDATKLIRYEIPYTPRSWFDLSELDSPVNQYLQVFNSSYIHSHDYDLRYPAATLYDQQELAFTAVGEAQMVQRALRAMIVCQATPKGGGDTTLAVFDLALSPDGKMAKVADSVIVNPIDAYQTALGFDGRGDSVEMNSDAVLDYSGESIFMSVWIRWAGPNDDGNPQDIVSLYNSSEPGSIGCTITIDGEGHPRFTSTEGGTRKAVRAPVALIPGQWANLAVNAIDNGSGGCEIRMWLNGSQIYSREVNINSSLQGSFGLALGKSPKASGEWKNYYSGEMGQFYLSTATIDQTQSDTSLPLDWVYASNIDDIIPTPMIFWSFSEGAGQTIQNDNTSLSSNSGNILGAIWESTVCPDQSTMPLVCIDGGGRDTRAALLSPTDSNSPPVSPKNGFRPSFMRSADGYLHLYYQDTNDHACALQMSTAAQRARYALYQHLDIDGDGTTEIVNMLTLVSRRAGIVWGQLTVTFDDISNGKFSHVSFTSDSFPNMSEIWSDVPARLDLFAQVINGEAAQPGSSNGDSLVTDADIESEWGQVQYDYKTKLYIKNPYSGSTIDVKGVFASRLFEAVVPEKLLNRNPVPSLGSQDVILQNIGAGNDPGWIRVPIQPALKLAGGTGVNGWAEDAPELDIDGDLTVQCWIQRTASLPTEGVIVNYVGDAASYALGIDTFGNVTARRTGFDSQDITGISRSTEVELQGSRWVHLAAVYHASYALHLLPGVYVECKDSSDFNLPDAFTLETWVKFDPELIGRSAILSRRSFEQDGTSFELSAKSESDSTRKFRLEVCTADGVTTKCEKSFEVDSNSWAHIAATFHSDISFNYLEFQDSEHNFVELGLPTQDPLSTFTVELFVKVRDAEKQSLVSFDRAHSSGTYDTRNYFQVGYLNSSSPKCLGIQIEDSQIDISTDSWDPDVNEWRALSVVVETVEVSSSYRTYVSVYVDGVPALIAGTSTPAIRVLASRALDPGNDTFNPWVLGMEWDSSGHSDYADMDLAEFRLWSTVRSEEDILNTFRAPLIGDEPGLVRYVVFDSEPGSGARSVVDRVSGKSFPIHVHEDGTDMRWHTLDVGGKIELYLNGESIGSTSVQGPNNTLAETSTPLTMGRRAKVEAGGSLREFAGSIDDVRIWNCRRASCQLDYFRLNELPDIEKQQNLVAYWRFDKPEGSTIKDLVGGHTGKIKGMEFTRTPDSGVLWEPSVFGADWTIYIDGVPVGMNSRSVLNEEPANSAPDSGLYVGCGSQMFFSCIDAYLNELQIWDQARTYEEISTTRHQPEAPREGLKGYYRFNDGASSRASDLSGYGADIELEFSDSTTDPSNAWVAYDGGAGELNAPAPVRDEALKIINVTNGYVYPEANELLISGPPSVVDDLNSGVRVYSWCSGHSRNDGALNLNTDLPLSGTELVYLGQVQYKPQLVGYIEGAPPVPSENLTIDAPSNPDRYLGNSSTSLSLASGSSVNVSSSIGINEGVSKTWRGGLATENKRGSSYGMFVGVPGVGGNWLGIGSPMVDSSSNKDLSLKLNDGFDFGYAQNGTLTLSSSKTYGATLDGGWENMCYKIAGDTANPYQIAGRRLYRPNNMASAVVKSRTADFYAVRSSKTKAMLGYQASVNPEIPEDINIINFKLNPKYVRNGSLDGYIGFDNDQYYKDLSIGKKGSYFKPEQAYRLKRTIDREAKRAASDLSQLNPFGGASDYSEQLTTSSLANTYVWTADAGTYVEEHGAASSFSEHYSGGYQAGLEAAYTSNQTTEVGWGFLAGADIGSSTVLDAAIKLNYSHTSQDSKVLSLTSNVNSEGFLYRVANFSNWTDNQLDVNTTKNTLNSGDVPAIPIDSSNPIYAAFAAQGIELTEMNRVEIISADTHWKLYDLYVIYDIQLNDPEFAFTYVPTGTANSQYAVNYDYAAAPCPGKVRGFRYMSLFLTADKSNFDSLFAEGEDQVIDPEWLSSDDPDAIALRQASNHKNAAWRLMHRVTYVNRVPPLADDWAADADAPDSQDVSSPPVRPDEHSIHHNSTIIQRVIKALPSTSDKQDAGDLDFHALELSDVDMSSVTQSLEDILDELSITDDKIRKMYLADMVEFFELLFMPDEKQTA